MSCNHCKGRWFVSRHHTGWIHLRHHNGIGRTRPMGLRFRWPRWSSGGNGRHCRKWYIIRGGGTRGDHCRAYVHCRLFAGGHQGTSGSCGAGRSGNWHVRRAQICRLLDTIRWGRTINRCFRLEIWNAKWLHYPWAGAPHIDSVASCHEINQDRFHGARWIFLKYVF